MRRRLPPFALALAVASAFATVAIAQSQAAYSLSVPIDQSARIVLPAGTQNVMIGNPSVADVNVLDAGSAILLGRSYGVTNLLITDGRGRVLMNRQVVVSAPDLNRVTLYRGPGGQPTARVENYACAPRCERTPMPGETDADFSRFQAPYTAYAGRAQSGGSSSGGGGGIGKAGN